MERSRRNSIEMRNEKLVQDLKRAQQTTSSLEKSVKSQENKVSMEVLSLTRTDSRSWISRWKPRDLKLTTH